MIPIGERVAIDEGSKTGTLRFLGPTQFRHGLWAGIELDQPLGKHDGTVQGVSYFDCPSNHGIFVHPSKVTRLLDHSNKNTHSNANHSVSNQHQNQIKSNCLFVDFIPAPSWTIPCQGRQHANEYRLRAVTSFYPFKLPLRTPSCHHLAFFPALRLQQRPRSKISQTVLPGKTLLFLLPQP